MTYATKERAEQVAAELNMRRGHPRARAILMSHGWTVIADYYFGVSGPAAVPYVDVSNIQEYGLTQKLSQSVRVF